MSSYTLPTLAKGYRFTINNCAAINLWMKWNIVIKQRQPFTRSWTQMSTESFHWMKWGKLVRNVFKGLVL